MRTCDGGVSSWDEVGGVMSLLEISVQVNLDNTVADASVKLFLGGTGATVEDEEQGLVLGGVDLLLGVGLVLAQELGVEVHVSGLVDSVDVSESGGDGEVGGDRDESRVHVVDVLRLGVQSRVVDSGVVDSVLLTSGDSDFLSLISLIPPPTSTGHSPSPTTVS